MLDCPTLGTSREGRILWKKTMMLGKTEGSRKRGRTNRWIDCTKEAIGRSLQELSRAAEDRILWTSLIQSRQEAEPTLKPVTLSYDPASSQHVC